MAIVYRAYDSVLQRTVALKVLLPFLAANAELAQRFQREAITAANLRHPNIVVIYDVGSYDSFQYIVMEYVDGPTLQQEVQARGALPVARVVGMLAQLAGALDHAHQQGLIHRDVKPANIMLGAHDRVTLTDFGLVKAVRRTAVTSEGVTTGTLKYMSPEQAMGRELTHRSDVYSLGVVVYEMLAGQAPFNAETPYEALRALIHEAPPPLVSRNPSVDPRLDLVVLQALAKEPERRYTTAGEFATTLAAVTGLGAALEQVRRTDTWRRAVALILTAPDGREYPVCHGLVTIGRDTANDIVLPISQISRRHAQIETDAAGCRITDVGSTNGTFVNGYRLPPETPFALKAGDVLGIGPAHLLAVLPAARRHLPGTETFDIVK